MPLSYGVDVARNLVHTVGTGVLSNADLVRHVAALAADPRVRAGYRELFDARRITRIEATIEAFDQMAAIERSDLPKFTGTKIAIVLQEEAASAYAEQFERRVAARPITVIVFNNLDVAWAWLGLGEA